MEKNTNNNKTSELKIKLLIIGDSDVGKTSMLLKYTDNFFPESHLATIGVEFKTKEIEFQDYKISLQIWDTAGQERFRSITKSFFRSTNGIIFMYDITDKNTFKNVKDWVKDSENNDTGFKKILVGNKIDLKNKRKVELKEVKEWADKKELEVMEASAKLGTNVDKVFLRLVELILDKKAKDDIIKKYGINGNKENTKLKSSKETNNKKGKCC